MTVIAVVLFTFVAELRRIAGFETDDFAFCICTVSRNKGVAFRFGCLLDCSVAAVAVPGRIRAFVVAVTEIFAVVVAFVTVLISAGNDFTVVFVGADGLVCDRIFMTVVVIGAVFGLQYSVAASFRSDAGTFIVAVTIVIVVAAFIAFFSHSFDYAAVVVTCAVGTLDDSVTAVWSHAGTC